jgi:hypothetical protein
MATTFAEDLEDMFAEPTAEEIEDDKVGKFLIINEIPHTSWYREIYLVREDA